MSVIRVHKYVQDVNLRINQLEKIESELVQAINSTGLSLKVSVPLTTASINNIKETLEDIGLEMVSMTRELKGFKDHLLLEQKQHEKTVDSLNSKINRLSVNKKPDAIDESMLPVEDPSINGNNLSDARAEVQELRSKIAVLENELKIAAAYSGKLNNDMKLERDRVASELLEANLRIKEYISKDQQEDSDIVLRYTNEIQELNSNLAAQIKANSDLNSTYNSCKQLVASLEKNISEIRLAHALEISSLNYKIETRLSVKDDAPLNIVNPDIIKKYELDLADLSNQLKYEIEKNDDLSSECTYAKEAMQIMETTIEKLRSVHRDELDLVAKQNVSKKFLEDQLKEFESKITALELKIQQKSDLIRQSDEALQKAKSKDREQDSLNLKLRNQLNSLQDEFTLTELKVAMVTEEIEMLKRNHEAAIESKKEEISHLREIIETSSRKSDEAISKSRRASHLSLFQDQKRLDLENKNLKEALDSHRNSSSDNDRYLVDATNEIMQLKSSQKQQNELIQDYKTQIIDLTKSNVHSTNLLKETESRLANSQKTLADLQKSSTLAQNSEKEAIEKDLIKAKCEISDLNISLQSQKDTVSDYQHQIKRLTKSYDDAQRITKETEARLNESQKQIDSLKRSKNESENHEVLEARNQISKLKNDFINQKETINEYDGKMSILSQSNDRVRNQLENSEKQVVDLQIALASKDSTINASLESVKHLYHVFEFISKILEEKTNRSENPPCVSDEKINNYTQLIKDKADALVLKCKRRESIVDEIKKTVNVKNEELLNLEAENSKLMAKLKSSADSDESNKNTETEKQVHSLKADKQNLKDQLSRADNELARLESEIKEISSQSHAKYQSLIDENVKKTSEYESKLNMANLEQLQIQNSLMIQKQVVINQLEFEKEQVIQLKQTSAAANERVRTLQTKIYDQQSQVLEAQIKSSEDEVEIKKLLSIIRSLEYQQKHQSSDLNMRMDQSIQHLERELEESYKKTEQVEAKIKDEVAEKQSIINSQLSEIEILKNECRNFQSQLLNLENSLKSMAENREAQIAEIQQLKAENEQLKSVATVSKEQVKSDTSQISEYINLFKSQMEHQELIKENASLRIKLEKQAHRHVQILNQNRIESDSQLSSLLTELDSQIAKRDIVDREKESVKQKIIEVNEREIRELQNELNSLRQRLSTSNRHRASTMSSKSPEKIPRYSSNSMSSPERQRYSAVAPLLYSTILQPTNESEAEIPHRRKYYYGGKIERIQEP